MTLRKTTIGKDCHRSSQCSGAVELLLCSYCVPRFLFCCCLCDVEMLYIKKSIANFGKYLAGYTI